VYADENDAAVSHPFRPLQCDLPEITVEREEDSAFGLGPFQNLFVAGTGVVVAHPQDVVTGITERFDNAAGKILICEKSHLCGEGIGPEFVREVTGVGETGEEIFARQTWIAGEQVALGLSCGEKFEN